jgi:hypothetical protein
VQHQSRSSRSIKKVPSPHEDGTRTTRRSHKHWGRARRKRARCGHFAAAIKQSGTLPMAWSLHRAKHPDAAGAAPRPTPMRSCRRGLSLVAKSSRRVSAPIRRASVPPNWSVTARSALILVSASVLIDFLLGRKATVEQVLADLRADNDELLHAPDPIEPQGAASARAWRATQRAAGQPGAGRARQHPPGSLSAPRHCEIACGSCDTTSAHTTPALAETLRSQCWRPATRALPRRPPRRSVRTALTAADVRVPPIASAEPIKATEQRTRGTSPL